MSSDPYEESGLYSHSSSASPARQQLQHKYSVPLTSSAPHKKRKNNSVDFSNFFQRDNVGSQHRKPSFICSKPTTETELNDKESGNSSAQNTTLHRICPLRSNSFGDKRINSVNNASNLDTDISNSVLFRNKELSTEHALSINSSTAHLSDLQNDNNSNNCAERSLNESKCKEKFRNGSNISTRTKVQCQCDVSQESHSNLNKNFIINEISMKSSNDACASNSVTVSPTLTAASSSTVTNIIANIDVNATECGILSCRPSFLQRLATIKVFILFLSLLVTVQQAVASGYLNSVITTLEKRYEVPSYVTGLISSMYEIGNVATVIFVSYLGSSRHIPVWIAVGCVAMGTGSLLFVGPQLMMDRWSMESPGINSTNSSSICMPATVHHQPIDQLPELGFPKLPRLGMSDDCPEEEARPSQLTPVLLFMAGQLLLGGGGSPLLTLGTTYIDDHVRRQDSSLYIGIIYTMGAFGPVLGFLLGGYLLSFYVDTFFIPDAMIKIDRNHPRWIGMWWAGFLLCSIALFALAIPFLMFPKKLTKEKEKVRLQEKKHSESFKGHKRSKSETSTCSKLSRTSLASRRLYGKDVRDIPACLFKLILNPIYFMTCLAACMELIIVSGFIVFLPKYLETQFSLSNVQASVFTGGVAIPGACVGTFLGGYILKRFSLRPKGAVQMLMICNLFGLSLYGLFFVLGCENVKMAGATSPYFVNKSGSFQGRNPPVAFELRSSASNSFPSTTMASIVSGINSFSSKFNGVSLKPRDDVTYSSAFRNDSEFRVEQSYEVFRVNLTSWCNTGCECSSRLAEPVCGNNGLTYFSPCHAGCTAANTHSFSNCTCIDSSLSRDPASDMFAEVVAVPVATAGPCYITCNTFVPFMVVLFLMCASVATSQMPLLMIVLRSVSEEERALALGLQFVLYRLIAYIPAPIMFGSVIDSTCLMWTSSCGGGRCLMYDIEQFRFRYIGICASIKLIAAAIFLFDWLLIRYQYKLDLATGILTLGDIVNSLRSVDRGTDEEEDIQQFDNVDSCFGGDSRQGSINNNMKVSGSLRFNASSAASSSSSGDAQYLQHKQLSNFSPPVHKSVTLAQALGHKRSQSGCPSWTGNRWGATSGAAAVPVGVSKIHRRSHSSSSPPHGILANLPGHVRRPSVGYQVTFWDSVPHHPSLNCSDKATGDEELAQLELLLPDTASVNRS